MVVMVRGVSRTEKKVDIDPEAERLMRILMVELPLKQASKLVAEITGLKKKPLYQWGVEQNQGDQ